MRRKDDEKETAVATSGGGSEDGRISSGTHDDEIVEGLREAYGIPREYLLLGRVDAVTGEVVLVTHGGKKIRHREGDEPMPLSEIEITGINPENARRKVVAGKKR